MGLDKNKSHRGSVGSYTVQYSQYVLSSLSSVRVPVAGGFQSYNLYTKSVEEEKTPCSVFDTKEDKSTTRRSFLDIAFTRYIKR